jgi:hypothetical protein
MLRMFFKSEGARFFMLFLILAMVISFSACDSNTNSIVNSDDKSIIVYRTKTGGKISSWQLSSS